MIRRGAPLKLQLWAAAALCALGCCGCQDALVPDASRRIYNLPPQHVEGPRFQIESHGCFRAGYENNERETSGFIPPACQALTSRQAMNPHLKPGAWWQYVGPDPAKGSWHLVTSVDAEGVTTFSRPSPLDNEGGWSWFGPVADFLNQFVHRPGPTTLATHTT